jgi:DNA-binding CsgD family transcriptional regulator
MRPHDLHEADATDVGRRPAGWATGLFAAIALLVGLDVLSDAGTGVDWWHLVAEALVMALALAGAVLLWRHLRTAEARAGRLQVDLEQALVDAARYRSEAQAALAGLGDAIDAQFGRWGLTPAEREVGLLLLKGLSHRDVAGIRDTGEATIRQQALAIYRKSGLRSRAELSAFFLEDLLLPTRDR